MTDCTTTVAELAAQLRTQKVSAVEAARHFLARGQQHAELGAFLDVREDVTLAQARCRHAARGRRRRPLLGVPVAHKDIFVTRDFVSTAGSKMLAGYRSPFDATVVERLARQAP
jgi:aspartyl-tRNA(Asn)/glutamyl-tRNA(Gln) amidotransferase subunit A